MPRRFEDTPNPNALRCELAKPRNGPVISIRNTQPNTPPDTHQDPIAQDLAQIPGVTGLLLHERFLTINKAPDARWAPITKAATQALEKHGL